MLCFKLVEVNTKERSLFSLFNPENPSKIKAARSFRREARSDLQNQC